MKQVFLSFDLPGDGHGRVCSYAPVPVVFYFGLRTFRGGHSSRVVT